MESPSTRQVAIVGRPNVGKSALFNRLVGRNIAIVHDQPGITRDRISAPSRHGDFILWDTGGIGGAGESELVHEVKAAADAAMREAELILLVVDAQQGLTPIDQELARMLRRSQRPVLLVINKIDHPKHQDLEADFQRLGFTSLTISAAHGQGIDSLVKAIEARLPQAEASDQSSAVPPLSLAIIGRPNVGKSSLINAIVSDRRAIVSGLPGTTRDAVDIAYRRGHDEFLLIDTAGIRARGKHSSCSWPRHSEACGSPATTTESTRASPCRRLNSRISSFTQCECAAAGEHTTIKKPDRSRTPPTRPFRSAAAARSPRSRKIGLKDAGAGPTLVSRPTSRPGTR